MNDTIKELLVLREQLKPEFFMKVALSYGGCLSFSVAKKKDNKGWNEKVWQTMMTLECRVPNEENLKGFLEEAKRKLQPYLRTQV